MVKHLAWMNGMLLALMIFLNGVVSSYIGAYLGTLIFHMMGFILLIVIAAFNRHSILDFSQLKPYFLLPGILSVTTITLNNLAIPQIGLTIAVGLTLFGQLVMSTVVEHFGLLGYPQNPLRLKKVIGFVFICLGILAMIVL